MRRFMRATASRAPHPTSASSPSVVVPPSSDTTPTTRPIAAAAEASTTPSLPPVALATPLEQSLESTTQGIASSSGTPIRRGSGADVSDIRGLMQATDRSIPEEGSDSSRSNIREQQQAAAASAEAVIDAERRLVLEARTKIEELEAQLSQDIAAQSRIASEWQDRYRKLEAEYQAQAQKCQDEKNQLKASMGKDLEEKMREVYERYQKDVRVLQGDLEKALNERDRIIHEKNAVGDRLVQIQNASQSDAQKFQNDLMLKDRNIEELQHRLIELDSQREEDVAETRRKWREDVAALKDDFRSSKDQYSKIEEERDEYLSKLTELQLQRDGEREQWERRLSDFQRQLASLDEIKIHDSELSFSVQQIRRDRDHAVDVSSLAEKLVLQLQQDSREYEDTFTKVSEFIPVMHKAIIDRNRLLTFADETQTDLKSTMIRLEEVRSHRDKLLGELDSLSAVLGISRGEIHDQTHGIALARDRKHWAENGVDGTATPSAAEARQLRTLAPKDAIIQPSEIYMKQLEKMEDKVKRLESEIAKLDKLALEATRSAKDISEKHASQLEEAVNDRQRLRETLHRTQSELGQINTALNTVLRPATPLFFKHVTHELECLHADFARLEEIYNKLTRLRTGIEPTPEPEEIPRETITITGGPHSKGSEGSGGKRRDAGAGVALGASAGAATICPSSTTQYGIAQGAPTNFTPHSHYHHESEECDNHSPTNSHNIRFRGIQSPRLPPSITRHYHAQPQPVRSLKERARIMGSEVLGRPTAPRAFLAGEMVPYKEWGGGSGTKIGLVDFSST